MGRRSAVMMKELYGIDMALRIGFTRRFTHVPPKFKEELMSGLDIIYNTDKKYYANLEDVYKYFANKYPYEIKKRKIFDYNGLVALAYSNMV